MRKGRRKLNQAGMSLVELIVVILILGILSVGTAVGINYAKQMDSTSAGEKLVSLLERTRVYTISAENTSDPLLKVKLLLTKEGNTYYGTLMDGSTQVDKVSLGNGSLTIKLTEEGASDLVIGSGGTPGASAEIAYKKANGAFDDSCDYNSIVIDGSKTRTIRLVNTTGRSYLE